MEYTITCNDFDKLEQNYKALDYKADFYLPSDSELNEMEENGVTIDVLNLLLWIESTGIETPENKNKRKKIRHIIHKYLMWK